jgi:hypothetical protein
MHRRARHLNAKDAGARIALDARFLSGFSNGATVGTWTNRIGSSNFTSSGTQQPTFTASSIFGNPALTFDGVDDKMSSSTITWSADFVLVYVGRLNRTTPYTHVTIDTVAAKDDYISSGSARVGFYSYMTNTYVTTTNTYASTEYFSGTTGFPVTIINGVTLASATGDVAVGTPYVMSANGTGSNTNANTSFSLAYQLNLNQYGKIDLAYMAYIPVSSVPLRRRFEQAAALSYKIACS